MVHQELAVSKGNMSTVPDKSGTRIRAMFGSIAERYDRTNTVLSFGMHILWRRRLKRMIAECKPAAVLDLCTGTADVMLMLPSSTQIACGIDFCLPMLLEGKKKLSRLRAEGRGGIENMVLIQADAMQLPLPESCFDVVTVLFGARNFENLERGLHEAWRVLQPGGTMFIMEFGQPTQPLWGAIYSMYSRFCMPIIGGLLTGNFSAYRYLPSTAKHFPCGTAFEVILNGLDSEGRGKAQITTQALSGGVAYLYTVRKFNV